MSEHLEKIAMFGNKYIEEYITNRWRREAILKSWFTELSFFLHFTFFQGRRDSVSKRVKNVSLKVLNEYFNEEAEEELIKLKSKHFSIIEESLKEKIGKGKIGKNRDIKMIISTLNYVSEIKENRMVKYSIEKVKAKKLGKLYRDLKDKIYQIGPKIASLYLRDLIVLFKLEKFISKKDYIYLMPIDTWVKKVANSMKIINEKEKNELKIREDLVEACLELSVSPIKFNQGAWYLGTHSFEVVIENLYKL